MVFVLKLDLMLCLHFGSINIKLFNNFHCLALKSTKYNETGMYQTEYVTSVPSKLMVM